MEARPMSNKDPHKAHGSIHGTTEFNADDQKKVPEIKGKAETGNKKAGRIY